MTHPLLQHQADEFWAIYKRSTCAVERRRSQLLALLTEGKPAAEVLAITRYSYQGANKIVDAYGAQGMTGRSSWCSYPLFTGAATRRAIVAIDRRTAEEPSFRDAVASPGNPRHTVPLAGRTMEPGQSLDGRSLAAKDNK